MNQINNTEQLRQLDPVKIALTGLDMFMRKYQRLYIEENGEREEHLDLNGTLKQKTERLKELSENKNISDLDKKDMKRIIEILSKIADCNLCHKKIDWDKKEGMYAINPTETARHITCHKKAENEPN